MLYDCFKEYPHARIELRDIEEACNTQTEELNWNIVYLEKCGYVELSKSADTYSFVACSAEISAEGIDLVENEEAFNIRFPVEKDSKHL